MILLFIIQIWAMCSIIYQTVTKYGDKNKNIKNKHILRQSAQVLSYQVLSYHQCNSGNTNIVQKTITDKTMMALYSAYKLPDYIANKTIDLSRDRTIISLSNHLKCAPVCVCFLMRSPEAGSRARQPVLCDPDIILCASARDAYAYSMSIYTRIVYSNSAHCVRGVIRSNYKYYLMCTYKRKTICN